VCLTVAAYQQLAEACDYSLHISITEQACCVAAPSNRRSGPACRWSGIDDTIRVSPWAHPVEEVKGRLFARGMTAETATAKLPQSYPIF
jgi:(E)-4-hydroxy-3-methylbut-2-enyl-diphosphate synthase